MNEKLMVPALVQKADNDQVNTLGPSVVNATLTRQSTTDLL